jgi:hypothetical protein
MQDEDDSANMFWKTQGMQELFDLIFRDEVNNERTTETDASQTGLAKNTA